MEETLQCFRAWLEAQDRSPRTVRAYISDLSHFARWFAQTNGQPLTPEVMTPADVREYRQWMTVTQGLAPATVNRRIAALRAYTNWAYSAGLIAGDPTNLERLLEHAELKARLAQLEGRPTSPELVWARRDAALVHLMLNAGLRVDEATALETGHVELRERSGRVGVMGKRNKKPIGSTTLEMFAALREEMARPNEGLRRWVACLALVRIWRDGVETVEQIAEATRKVGSYG